MLAGARAVFRASYLSHSAIRSMSTGSQGVEQASSNAIFGGKVVKYTHQSSAVGTPMVFSVFIPDCAKEGAEVPAIYWLSGLTCTDDNFTHKAGAQRYAAEQGVALIAPDTSPRGLDLPGEHDAYDFGSGAGFYVNATQAPWDANYRMEAYITEELPALCKELLPISSAASIMGHSMGGHGALTLAMKNPGMFRSASAFSPICNPTQCAWGHKAFSGYLGDDEASWKAHDATELIKQYTGPELHFLVDQGLADNFYPAQLLPENFEKACQDAGVTLTMRYHEGYDHSYYFIATFIGDHVKHHATVLKSVS